MVADIRQSLAPNPEEKVSDGPTGSAGGPVLELALQSILGARLLEADPQGHPQPAPVQLLGLYLEKNVSQPLEFRKAFMTAVDANRR